MDKKYEDVKAMVGQFYEEVKSNSITEFMVWLDCKMTLIQKIDKLESKVV